MMLDNGAFREEFKRYYTEKLNDLRKKNDSNLDEIMTSQLRGQIKNVREVLVNLEKAVGTLAPDK